MVIFCFITNFHNKSRHCFCHIIYDMIYVQQQIDLIIPVYLLSSEIRNPLQYMVFRNLPEVRSAHEILGVPTVSARFGTAPFFWNWGMEAMTYLFPPVSLSCLDWLVCRLVQLLSICMNILSVQCCFWQATHTIMIYGYCDFLCITSKVFPSSLILIIT